jgi:hypothetical protein
MADRIHIRPVGDVKIRFPNSRVLPPEGALVRKSLFVQRRIDQKEVEVVEAQPAVPGATPEGPPPATVDDAVGDQTSEEHQV